MKTLNVKRSLFLFAALCGVLFLFIDFFMPSAASVSSPLKYAGLVACATIAILGEDRLLRAALLITAAYDYLLLFTDSFAQGVAFFACAQAFHAVRFARAAGFSPWKTVLPLGVAGALGGVITLAATRDTLIAAAIPYAVLLLTATTLSVCAYVRRKIPGQNMALAAGGMLLFVACDACVAAFRLGVDWVGNLMWLFYLPSQMLLVASALPEKQAPPPPPKPSGWHTGEPLPKIEVIPIPKEKNGEE